MASIFRFLSVGFFLIAASSFVCGQDYVPPSYFYPNQEVRVSGLPLRVAQSNSSGAVLAASLETVLQNPEVCCGKNSALEDAGAVSDSMSLEEVGEKLPVRSVLGDGRRITITAEYLPASSITSAQIIAPLLDNQALLIEWDLHIYVVAGALFNERLYASGVRDYALHKLFLLDTRFSGMRREVVFDRTKDDWTRIQGLLILRTAPE